MSGIECPIRPADIDGFGHVNNAVYISHLERALATILGRLGYSDDWSAGGDYGWQLRSLAIEYRQAATLGERLAAELWPTGVDQDRLIFGGHVHRLKTTGDETTVETLVRARVEWSRICRETGKATAVPDELLAAIPKGTGKLPRPFKAPSPANEVRFYTWDQHVGRTAVGPGGLAHPQAVYQWIEEGIFDASAQGDWPFERCLAAGFVVFQMRHDTQFFAFPKLGDDLRFTNRLVDVHRLRGTWLNEIHRRSDARLLARNYSTGVFLDLTGRPASPPEGMMDELRYL